MRRRKTEPSAIDVIERKRNRIAQRENWRGLFIRIMLLVSVGYIILTQVFMITQVDGESMFPSLKDGDLVIGFRLQTEPVKQKDIVVYHMDNKERLGRVVACYGDVVNITEDGELEVNGTVQKGDIIFPTYPGEALTYPYRIPENCVFLLVDYRTKGGDSRDFEAIPLELVEAKVITILRRRGL